MPCDAMATSPVHIDRSDGECCPLDLATSDHFVFSFPVDLVAVSLPDVYVDKMLDFCASKVESSPHLEFYLLWIQKLLFAHGPRLKQRSQAIMSTLRSLQRNVTRKFDDISKLCVPFSFASHFFLYLLPHLCTY